MTISRDFLDLDLVIQLIWICNDLELYLDLYLDLLILYLKAKGPKIIKVFFEKIKTRSKIGTKPKLKKRL
jgi:hypothetical protein